MRYAIIVIILVVLAYLVMDFNSRMVNLNRLRSEREAVELKLESRKQTKAALEAEINYATSDAAVMKWAYENHFVRPGDQPVVPIEVSTSTPTPVPQEVIVEEEISNPQRWLSLFFDNIEP